MANIISEELLRAVIARKPKNEDIATFLPRELARLSALTDHLGRARANEYAESVRHRNVLDEIARAKRLVQEECPHYQHTYYPDASGGSDSMTTCNLCGKELAG